MNDHVCSGVNALLKYISRVFKLCSAAETCRRNERSAGSSLAGEGGVRAGRAEQRRGLSSQEMLSTVPGAPRTRWQGGKGLLLLTWLLMDVDNYDYKCNTSMMTTSCNHDFLLEFLFFCRLKELITSMHQKEKQAVDGGRKVEREGKADEEEEELGRERRRYIRSGDGGRRRETERDGTGRRAASEGRDSSSESLRWRVNRLEKEKLELASNHNQEVRITGLKGHVEWFQTKRGKLIFPVSSSSIKCHFYTSKCISRYLRVILHSSSITHKLSEWAAGSRI